LAGLKNNRSVIQLQPILQEQDDNNPLFSSHECKELIKIYAEYYEKIGFNPPWIGYFIVREDTVVGSCSFTGKPVDGKVEIAYWTFKDYEGQGIAFFACKELVRIAKETDPSVIVTAKTAPEDNASTHILENNGFVKKGVVQDHEIGDAWFWELISGFLH
jgi:[ribosomal protein S5]-alanine N-acetyltransferase